MSEKTEVPVIYPDDLKRALVQAHIPHRLPLLVSGKPGVGKTSIIEQSCDEIGCDYMIAHPTVDDPVDYKGMPYTYEETKTINGKRQKVKKAAFLPFGNLQTLIEVNGKGPFVHFADDLGQASKSVQAAYMQLVLNRAINGNKISDNVVFLAATNRKEDKAGVTGLIEPLKNRFVSIVELQTRLQDWINWAIGAQLETNIIAYVRYRPDVLMQWKPTADLTQTPTPRGIEACSRIIQANLPRDLWFPWFQGAIGKAHAIELYGFLEICEKLPDPDKVLMNPEKAPIPLDENGNPDGGPLYALCGALAARAGKNNIDRIITYANRLPKEFSVLLVKDSITYNNNTELAESKKFLQWVSEHEDVLIA